MKESLKHEIQATNEGYSEEERQIKLQEESRKQMLELKDRLDRNYDKNSQRKKGRIDELIEQHRQDQKGLHEREERTIKDRFSQKLQIE